MRLLTPRRVAVTALCAALTLGTAGPAIAHSTHQPAKEQQAKAPEDISDILGSIGSVLDSVLGTLSGTSSAQTLPATDMSQQMKDLTAAIEALKKAVEEKNTAATGTGTGTGTGMTADDISMDIVDTDTTSDTTMDGDLDKALATMDKAIDDMVAAAVNGQGATSASQIQAATKNLVDTIMRDVAKMTGTPTTGMNPLPAVTLPATTLPATGL
ncbi:hypothetical protein AMK26_24680 [Streptomyces sp. CB03234]|uniref:hypothetical protein n=1 Tax=Streptomyces sp. (strain CB03234) TaxID=1703937 RepID=UPI00093DBDFB|nr:hypothetical protein [Streptomyces sp. CB03234]OKK02775.1 hypothetical protein AMK26_24680 [Streptomyces sp. CB03234]